MRNLRLMMLSTDSTRHELITHGKMLGNDVFNQAIERLKPKLYLCGHVHIISQMLKLSNVTLLNPDSSTRHKEYAVAEFSKARINSIRVVSSKG